MEGGLSGVQRFVRMRFGLKQETVVILHLGMEGIFAGISKITIDMAIIAAVMRPTCNSFEKNV